jgi:hypothetical protein
VLEIKPLTSLKEILDIMGDDMSEIDEATIPLIMMELLPRLMLTDAGKVQALLEELMNSKDVESDQRTKVSGGLLMRWMMLQPELAVRFSMDHSEELGDMQSLNMMGLALMAKTKPREAHALAALLPGDEREDVQRILAKIDSLTDPASALKNLSLFVEMDSDHAAVLAKRWMRTDPVAALAWLNGLPEAARSAELTAAIASVRAQQDPASAQAWIAAMPYGEAKNASRDALLGHSLQNLADETAFEAKLATLPSDWHDAARLRWMNESSKPFADCAAEFQALLARSPYLGNDYQAGHAAEYIAKSFATEHNYTSGAEWLLSLPHGEAQVTAASHLMGPWTEHDPTAASSWVSSLPPGPTKEGAVVSLIDKIEDEDPASALVWAQSLADAGKRKDETQEVYQAWFKEKPLEAAAAIQKLPQDQQQMIFGEEKAD